ncbi:MAG TPA: hypothetical protein VG713_01305 [Pirellulales bacterium]|nr:hypothetical protein [Pirellulales bacterium]
MKYHGPIWVVIVAALFAAVGRAEPQPGAIEYRRIELRDGHFACDIPRDWEMSRDEHEEARIHYAGFFLVGPRQGDPLPPTISARYFAPDNTLFKDADAYLSRQLQPGLVQVQGETTSAVREATLDGQPAKTFTRNTFDFVPPESLDSKRIDVREQYWVAPHRKGFVVLKFTAPTASFDRWHPAFARLIATFAALPANEQ